MAEIPNNGTVGMPHPIDDAALKATGQLRYVDDLKFSGLLYGKILFSNVPHAKIRNIDTIAAEAMDGVHAVVSYKNTPGVFYNSSGETLDVFKTERVFDDTVRFVGDRVAAVAAETPELAAAAIRAIKVEYEPLPVNFDPEAGARDDAYVILDRGDLYRGNIMEIVRQSCGDVDKAFSEAPYVFEETYTVPRIHHGALEPHGCVAFFDAGGKLTVYTSSQDSFAVRINLSRIFSLPMSRVRVSVPGIGGAFGGKVDMVTEPVAAALSIQCGRPVKLVFTRREDIVSSRTRHAMKIRIKMGFAEDGTILAEDMTVFCNAGAYASGTSSIVWAMCGKLFKVHCCKNIRFTGYPVITNTPLGGPMRGFGSPQTFFAQQRLMDRAAKALGIGILNLQYENLTHPQGFDYRFDQPHGNARPIDCLKRAVKLIDYDACLCEQNKSVNERFRIGIGVSVGAHGNGMFGIRTDITAMILKMNDDGSCVLFSGSHEMGNSSITLQKQIVSEVLGLPMEMLAAVSADTELTPYQLGDYSSRGAFVSGRAALLVAEDMRKKLSELAAEMLETETADFAFSGGRVTAPDGKSASIGEIVQFARHHKFTELISEKTAASPASVVSYGAHIVKVRVDTLTGKVELLDYAAVHDVGRAINPLSVRGQIEGAVQMGAGYALTEDIRLDENGRVKNTTFRTYHMLHANEMPKRLMIDLIEEIEPAGPFGAKSIGECSVVPVAAAVANAISNAVGCEFNDLPITPERILTALKNK